MLAGVHDEKVSENNIIEAKNNSKASLKRIANSISVDI